MKKYKQQVYNLSQYYSFYSLQKKYIGAGEKFIKGNFRKGTEINQFWVMNYYNKTGCQFCIGQSIDKVKNQKY